MNDGEGKQKNRVQFSHFVFLFLKNENVAFIEIKSSIVVICCFHQDFTSD